MLRVSNVFWPAKEYSGAGRYNYATTHVKHVIMEAAYIYLQMTVKYIVYKGIQHQQFNRRCN